ncbi:MAG: phosphatidate cytidylyltransferase [Deltaproteobacteria bacterium]|nr:phosphatidate cytidylyltransferase [Deltaproteobacteria bacterium]MBW2306285.1 phosphatidate cytidylyltransferase [Deltaproteobacteria bacterium]
MLLRRWLTALALLGFVIPLLLIASPFWVLLVVQAFAALALYEFFAHALQKEPYVFRIIGMGMGVGLSAAVCFGGPGQLGWALVLIVLMTLGLGVLCFPRTLNSLDLAGRLLLGTIYIGFLFSHMGLILTLPKGQQWIGLAVISTLLVDTGAFYGGYFFGRKKLCPSISPNKTVEGAVGGMLGGLLGVSACKLVLFPQISPAKVLLLATGIGLMSQIGDLCESMLKRSLNIKDFGSSLPGHGGFLDRIDSFLFTAPFVFYVAVWLPFY